MRLGGLARVHSLPVNAIWVQLATCISCLNSHVQVQRSIVCEDSLYKLMLLEPSLSTLAILTETS